jgi:hypothetical protein
MLSIKTKMLLNTWLTITRYMFMLFLIYKIWIQYDIYITLAIIYIFLMIDYIGYTTIRLMNIVRSS